MKPKVYTSLKQCSTKTKIPYGILKAAKNHPDQKGFTPDGRIYWTDAEPFIQAHYDELENDEMEKWKLRKLMSATRQEEIKEAKLKGETIDRIEAEAQLKAISIGMCNILKSKLTQEMPSRLLGMDVVSMSIEGEKIVNEIVDLMKQMNI
jgi:hypothetical protein